MTAIDAAEREQALAELLVGDGAISDVRTPSTVARDPGAFTHVVNGEPPGELRAERDGHEIVLTLGRGVHSADGERRVVACRDLPAALEGHVGKEAWFIVGDFEDGHREHKKWLRSDAITLDVDPAAKTDVPLSDAERATLWALTTNHIRPTFAYLTNRGVRLGFVLRESCVDATLLAAAADSLCDRVDEVVRDAGFVVDRGASTNRAQLMFTPCATVKGRMRQGRVQLIGSLFDGQDLASPATNHSDNGEHRASEAHRERAEQVHRATRPFATLEDAVAAYREAHPIRAELTDGKTGLSCPICGHHGCASLNLDAPHRAFCFSSNHENDGSGRGIKTERGYMFDSVDVHSGRAKLSRAEFLQREGWLDPAAVFDKLTDEVSVSATPGLRRQRLRLVTAAELAARPRRPDLWARMMSVNSLGVWYGAPKCGKSILGLALGIAIAEAKPFLGRDTIVDVVEEPDGGTRRVPRKGVVIYVCGEGVSGVADKIAAAIGPERVRDANDPFHKQFFIVPAMPNLTNHDDVKVLLDEIGKLGVRADLIVVDTVARALGAAALDENATEDMGRFVAALDTLRERTGAAVLGIHHAGKNGTDRGSSALRGAADMFAKIERVQPLTSRFEVEDMRDGEPADPIEVRFEPRVVGQDAHGQVERWAVADSQPSGAGSTREGDLERLHDREMLQAIRALIAAGASTQRSDLQRELRISKPEANRRLARLREAGSVRQIGRGRDARYVESPPTQTPESEPESMRASFDSSRLRGLRTLSQSRSRRRKQKRSPTPTLPQDEAAALHEMLNGVSVQVSVQKPGDTGSPLPQRRDP